MEIKVLIKGLSTVNSKLDNGHLVIDNGQVVEVIFVKLIVIY